MLWNFRENVYRNSSSRNSSSIVYYFLLVYVLMNVGTCQHDQHFGYMYECEPIQVDMCKRMPYNMTHMPNILGQETQIEVELEMTGYNYEFLIRSGCSKDLRLFLCAVYTPMCNVVSYAPFPPCRDLCESVRKGCEPVVKSKGYDWPNRLSCESYPKKGLCFDKPRTKVTVPPKGVRPTKTAYPSTSVINPKVTVPPQDRPTAHNPSTSEARKASPYSSSLDLQSDNRGILTTNRTMQFHLTTSDIKNTGHLNNSTFTILALLIGFYYMLFS
ncbi:protein mom-5-like [Anneissia japonica]|uniref:protein mom-5-like n=1 Tax=Anneissia japonica TaxID=1529436 RepID=UPI0014258128|nr:protein mom-5-like [Anneissia japonica]